MADTKIAVKRIAIHEIVRESSTSVVPKVGNVLPGTAEGVQFLVETVVGIYGKKDSRAYHGKFKEEGTVPFRVDFDLYRESNLGDAEFEKLTRNGSYYIAEEAQKKNLSTGGYLVFSEYQQDGSDYFLVVVIKQSHSVVIENLLPREIMQLDLGKINQAMRVSIADYEHYKDSMPIGQDGTTDDDEATYLSFITTTSGESVSGYFVDALGCTKQIAAKVATKRVINETYKLFSERSDLKPHRQQVRSDIEAYLAGTDTARLSEIEEIVRSNIPLTAEGGKDKATEKIMDTLTVKHKVPKDFPVSKNELNKQTFVTEKTDNWSLSIKRAAVSTSEGADVTYNKTRKELTLRNLSQKLIDDIENSLSES